MWQQGWFFIAGVIFHLERSSCIFSTFSINKSAPWGNFTSIYKKNHQKIGNEKSYSKKFIWNFSGQNFSKKIEIEIFDFFHWKLYEKWKILRSKKIENLGQKKYEVEEVRETFWYLFFIESFLIKSKMSADIQRFNMFHSRKRTLQRKKTRPLKS